MRMDQHQPQDDAAADQLTATLARAFDRAWDRFRAIEGTAADTPEARKRLAGKIVALARSGETDEAVLAEAGLIDICVLAQAIRLGARNRSNPPPQLPLAPEQGTQAYSPETVRAMTAALDHCLDALPLQAPSSAVSFVSASILDDAARGERDPERLTRHALDALRNR
jgi:hypothetical protein